MFVMLNDGGTPKDIDHDMATRILIQRDFIFGLLTSGVAVTLLHGAEFRNSKVGWLCIICRQFIWMKHRYFLSC
jgi:ATP-dependent RNA helicase DDX60